jgi:hypothetical protein
MSLTHKYLACTTIATFRCSNGYFPVRQDRYFPVRTWRQIVGRSSNFAIGADEQNSGNCRINRRGLAVRVSLDFLRINADA